MWKKEFHIALVALLFAIMTGICQAQEYYYQCEGGYLRFKAGPGRVLVFEEAYYGSESGNPVCGTDRRGQRSCELELVDDILNYYCFRKRVCTVPVARRALISRCADPTRHLKWKAPLAVPERSAQRLCSKAEMVATAQRGFIFAFGHLREDCKITFSIDTSEKVQISFVSYYLINTQLVQCGSDLHITSRESQLITSTCSTLHIFVPQTSYSVTLAGNTTLNVRRKVLSIGFGFLLTYTVTSQPTVTELPVLPPTIGPTEQTFFTVSSGPLDDNGTTLTLPDPGITRFVKRDDIRPTAITEKDHKTIIIIVCMIILVAIITTTIVVFFVVKRLRGNVKHNDEVQNAVQSLAYRPSLERNRYGDLPTPTPDVIRRAAPTAPVPVYDSVVSSSPTQIQSSSPSQTETSPSTPRPAPRPVLFTENELYTGNEQHPETDTAIHGPQAETDPSPAHGPPLLPPRKKSGQLTTPEPSPYVNEKFEHGPTVDRATRPDRRSAILSPGRPTSTQQVPDSPPPPYVAVDPNLDTEVTNIIANLALSNGAYSPYLNI